MANSSKDKRSVQPPVSTPPRLGKARVVVERVAPAVEGGRYAVKRVLGDDVRVETDLICDGQDVVAGRVLFRHGDSQAFREVRLVALGNDRFSASFNVDALGIWEFVVEGCIDVFATWLRGLERKLTGATSADIVAHLRQGSRIVQEIAARAPAPERRLLLEAAQRLDDAERAPDLAEAAARDPAVLALASAYPGFEHASRSARSYEVNVEPTLARFSAWYEFFPRSCRDDGTHATLRDCEARLHYAAAMGFDVVYLPPIHPIGRTFRKGRNNSVTATPDEPGSPWAIGAAEGGHKSIHPELGTLEDLRWLVGEARTLGVEIALDIALQVSPDHPYVTEHPEWFIKRPDGSIQYAENPPKKYQDIYPFDFECEDAEALWRELLSIFLFWVEQGVTVFRVDNPHTKSLPFWRYCVDELKRAHPEVILLAEAFTRPRLMYALAKLGFSQSYTYFTWRTSKHELTEYLTELTRTEVAEFFRPNFWPNTPDILPEHLQFGGRAAFSARLVLAATLSSNYGIYGPAYELMDHVARPGSEEYLDNEKYELKRWQVGDDNSLRALITRLNHARRANPCLHDNTSLTFHPTDNDSLLCYSKRRGDNVVIVVVNLDPHHRHAGWVELDLAALGLEGRGTFQLHDLLSASRFLWTGARNYVELDPAGLPAHVFLVRARVRSEADFDYFA